MSNTVRKLSVIALVESAILAAAAIVLVLLRFEAPWGQGGEISLIMLPIIIIALRRGPAWGVGAGIVTGTIYWLIFTRATIHWGMIFLDFVIAFGIIGLVGFLRYAFVRRGAPISIARAVIAVITATLAAGILRFTSHFIGGILFWYDYAPEGQAVWLYSLGYNSSYLLPTIALTLAVIIPLTIVKQTRKLIFNESL